MGRFSNGAAYVDGQIVPISEAKISVLDWGFMHSDATYDVAHVWKGRAFRFDDHISRFMSNMEKLRMSIPYDAHQIKEILNKCIVATGFKDAYVEMICTRGSPQVGSRDPRSCTNNFIAFALPFIWVADPEKQKEGLHMIVSKQHRIAPQSVDPTIKNFHWLDMTMSLLDAYDRGGETTVLTDGRDNLVEGPGFNIFAVKDGEITVPALGALEGITRRTTMELARKGGVKVNEGLLPKEFAYGADEVFVTSTAGGIIPIRKIDDHVIGSGKPGPVTSELQRKYWELHSDPAYSEEVIYS